MKRSALLVSTAAIISLPAAVADPCAEFSTPSNTTSLIPSSPTDLNQYCYQCPSPEYAACVAEKDPLNDKHETSIGLSCPALGFTEYTSNDPVFVDAALYTAPKAAATSAADWNSTCSGPSQSPLKYGVDDYTAQTVGLPLDPPADESLSDAICCDQKYYGYAEPRGLYAQPDVALFRKVNQTGITTFYDSVCGIPLFRAPVNRTFAEWESETQEHGWPSFRTPEVISENVITSSDGTTLMSACGTKLGTLEPDADGTPRYCMDLVCIAGSGL